MSARDPYLDLPLHGVQVIEASAGTGKTYTLATLVTRLVVEQGYRIGQLLAVTYTEAATQELRKRIRERLQLALRVFDQYVVEEVVEESGEDASPEFELCRQIIADYLQAQAAEPAGETKAQFRLRLQQAVLETDLAAIFTIHGFCARVLREHALETGAGFAASTLLTNDRALRMQLAADLWRQHAQEADAADDLVALWKHHENLAEDLRTLLPDMTLLPPAAPLSDNPAPALHVAAQALMASVLQHAEVFREALLVAVADDCLNIGSYKQEWIEELFVALANWATIGNAQYPFMHEKLGNLRPDILLKRTKKGAAGKTPDSPLCHAVASYLDAQNAYATWQQQRQINLLHSLRKQARTRLATLKRQQSVQTYDDLIDGVADALLSEQGDALASNLRGQYRVALVDEFQDTDARQWGIFNRVFGTDSKQPALFLIGDPKQAIYGFRGGDVHTYLLAAKVAEHAPTLRHNFRSRPALISAINTLYTSCEKPFIDDDISFANIEPGDQRRDVDYLRDGQPAPALTLWQAPATGQFTGKGIPTAWSAEVSRQKATQACVAAIHGILRDASDGQAMLKDKRVAPGDIAVLVRTHSEATRIQQALVLAGIPAVAAGKFSVFATSEAAELHTLLQALLQAGDEGYLRAALSTVLIGVDAQGIATLETDGAQHRQWQQQAVDWRSQLAHGGPLALINALCAQQATRLLGVLDGERRLSNYLQLAECLQQAQATVLGLQGLVDWLAQQIASADQNDEAQLLRLESDAHRVQIITLHKSKGLEYPLVFLPFVGVGGKPKSPGRSCRVRDKQQLQVHWNIELAKEAWDAAKQRLQQQQNAEDTRMLYVGLTRAQHAVWIAHGPFFYHSTTALARLLKTLPEASTHGIVRDQEAPPLQLPRLPASDTAEVPPARSVRNRIHTDWWVHSFSQLANADSHHAGIESTGESAGDRSSVATIALPGGHDEAGNGFDPSTAAPVTEAEFDPRFAGNRFGVALHAAFEHVDFSAWRHWREGVAAPAGQADIIADALREQAYPSGDVADGVALCTRLIGHTLTVPLPEAVRLCDLPSDAHRSEIEFQFSLHATHVDALLQLLHAHGIVRDRQGFGTRQRLDGLMTGLIDLTYQHAGKWYVLDYKSNRLPAYDAATLQNAMAHSEYDLQAVIYTLALHRWLRFKFGDDYNYARDFGGIRYLFCRGLDAASGDSAGIVAQRFAPELIAALDVLFGHCAEGMAA